MVSLKPNQVPELNFSECNFELNIFQLKGDINKAFVRTQKLRQLTMVQIVLEQLSFRDLLYLQTDTANCSISLNINKPNQT